jgi:hypothetical protein
MVVDEPDVVVVVPPLLTGCTPPLGVVVVVTGDTGTVVVVVAVVVVVVVVAVGAAGVVGAGGVAQAAVVTTLSSSVTAAVWEKRPPSEVAPVAIATRAYASIVPTNVVPVPIVAALPTCQKTLQGCAPSSRKTVLFEAVIRVEPAWKMKTAFGSPPPFKVTVPVSPIPDAARYTPGVNVVPPIW